MSDLELRLRRGDDVLKRFGNQLAALGSQAEVVLSRALNHEGDKARTQVVRALTAQTGLLRKTIVKAVRRITAWPTRGLFYGIESKGGDIRLKFFMPRETSAGVSAAPWGGRRVFAGTFMKGGRFPNRVPLRMGGNVFKRAGSLRLPIEVQRSGLYIPDEMIKGASASAFETSFGGLVARVEHEIGRLLP